VSDWAPPERAPEPTGESPPPTGWGAGPPAPWGPPGSYGATPTADWPVYAAPPPPKPGIIPLRPLGVGELLDGAFTAIRRYPRATLGFAAVVMLVVETVQLIADYFLLNGLPAATDTSTLSNTQLTDLVARTGASVLVTVLITGLAVLLLTGMITAVIGDAVLGRPATAGGAWKRLRPLFPRLVGVSLLTFVVFATLAVAGFVPGLIVLATGSRRASAAVLVIGGIAGVLCAVYAAVSLSLAPAVVVLERQRTVASLRRSRALTKRSWWRIFGILILASIISSILSAVIVVPFGLLGGSVGPFGPTNGAGIGFWPLVVNGVGGMLAGTVVRPFTAGVVALLYLDRRMRTEALDVTLVRAASEPSPR
jgi:hypothetical protein